MLGFSAKEVAESLDTTVASVNSALQRARKTLDERLPEQSQQATLRSLGDDGVREIVERYMDADGPRGRRAWSRSRGGRGMVDAADGDVVPRALESIEAFLTEGRSSGAWR